MKSAIGRLLTWLDESKRPGVPTALLGPSGEPSGSPSDHGLDAGVRSELIEPVVYIRRVDDSEVRGLPWLERPDLSLEAYSPGCVDRRSLQRFGRSHTLERAGEGESQR